MDRSASCISEPVCSVETRPAGGSGEANGRPAAGQFNRDLRRGGLPDALGTSSDQWRYLLMLICSEYAYCTMYGVNIVDGNIISCANIQRSLTFGPVTADRASEPAFDEYWQALQALSSRIRNGRLAELRFNRGKPVSARTSEGGRRFRRLVKGCASGPDSGAV